MEQTLRIRQLKWLCRRGMKELDILLENFLARQAQQLECGQWREFEDLLQAEDDQLWDWLQNPQRPQASRFNALLSQIRRGSEPPGAH
jgi:antitoxin CptB